MVAYGTRPTRKQRRTKAEIDSIKEAMAATVEEIQPATVRQVFYQLVSRGVVAKTELEYKSTVCRLLSELRRDGTVPYGWIADNTRWMRKPTTYSGLEEMLAHTALTYRRALWTSQPVYVEVWLEKDALAGVIIEDTVTWDVPLMVTRGYPSLSYIHEATETIRHQAKPVFIYYFGDRDPSGCDIPRFVEAEVRERVPGAEIRFEVVAVTIGQIEEFSLPTRPTKQTDSRAKGFDGESVEVDALPPAVLRSLVTRCITQHIDSDALDRLEAVEAAERETLEVFRTQLSGRQ
jgi:hypothetical protein